LEIRKHTDIIKVLLKMRETKKSIISVSHHLKGIKTVKTSIDNYNRSFALYEEAASYFFQCCGFLKSQYFGESISPSSKKFLVTKLFLPSCKKFLEFKQSLSLIEPEAIYETSLKLLRRNVESITNSLYTILGELDKIN